MSISHALDSDHEINNEEGNDVFITGKLMNLKNYFKFKLFEIMLYYWHILVKKFYNTNEMH